MHKQTEYDSNEKGKLTSLEEENIFSARDKKL